MCNIGGSVDITENGAIGPSPDELMAESHCEVAGCVPKAPVPFDSSNVTCRCVTVVLPNRSKVAEFHVESHEKSAVKVPGKLGYKQIEALMTLPWISDIRFYGVTTSDVENMCPVPRVLDVLNASAKSDDG